MERQRAQTPLLKRRRILPPSFAHAEQARRSRAAVQIQHFWRWRSSLCDDPITLQPLLAGDALRLVESASCTQTFSATALAQYYLHTAVYENPLTRRPIVGAEVTRLCKRVDARTALALKATRLLQGDLLRWKKACDHEILEVRSDLALQELMASLDRGDFGDDSFAEYHDALRGLARVSEYRFRTSCIRHLALLMQRGEDDWAVNEVLAIHEDTEPYAEARSVDDEARPLLVRYLESLRSRWPGGIQAR